jgi:site-specific DNA-methyltransferase (adenine-specific)
MDPFVGTGTALIAALELNRRGIGIDVSQEYLEVARQRLEDFIQKRKQRTAQLTLL